MEVYVVPTAGGTPRLLVSGTEWAPRGGLTFSADSRSVLVGRDKGADDQIYRLPIDGGAPVATGIKLSHVARISAHPDGRQLAISTDVGMTETWVVQGLAALVKR